MCTSNFLVFKSPCSMSPAATKSQASGHIVRCFQEACGRRGVEPSQVAKLTDRFMFWGRGMFFHRKKGCLLISIQVSIWFSEDFWHLTNESDFAVIGLDNFPFDRGHGCWSILSESLKKRQSWGPSAACTEREIYPTSWFCGKIFTFETLFCTHCKKNPADQQ